MISRRSLFTGASLGALAIGLGACTITNGGGTLAGTLNVAKVKAYFTAGIDAANLMLAIPGISVALGAPGTAAVGVAETAITEAMNAFTAAAGNSLTVSINDSTVRTAVDTGVAAMKLLLGQFQTLLTKLVGSSIYSQVTITVQSLATVVALAEALLPAPGGSVNAAPLPMSEAQALANLGVR